MYSLTHIHVFFLRLMSCCIQSVFTGLFLAMLVFIADLYFLVKSPSIVDPNEQKQKAGQVSERSTELKAKQQ